MSFLLLLSGVFVGLYILAYIAKRRFGVLGLALAAGAYMSQLWVGDVTPLVAQTGIITASQPPLESIVAAGLILLPAVVLLIAGPSYLGKSQRLMGSVLFALLASVLLLGPLGSALVIDGVGETVYTFLTEYTILIVTSCLVIALLDILGIKTLKSSKKH